MRHSLLAQFIVTANTWNTGFSPSSPPVQPQSSPACVVLGYRLGSDESVRGFKSLKTFCWSFTGFCYRNRWLDLCLSVMKMWFHLFVFPYLFSRFFLSTFIIIIVQINRLQSVRVYVSVWKRVDSHKHTRTHSHPCVLCGIIPRDKIIIFHIFIFSLSFFVITLFEFKPFLPLRLWIVGRHFKCNPIYAVVEYRIHHFYFYFYFYLLDLLFIHQAHPILGKMQMNGKCQLCMCSDFFPTNQLKCNTSNVLCAKCLEFRCTNLDFSAE